VRHPSAVTNQRRTEHNKANGAGGASAQNPSGQTRKKSEPDQHRDSTANYGKIMDEECGGFSNHEDISRLCASAANTSLSIVGDSNTDDGVARAGFVFKSGQQKAGAFAGHRLELGRWFVEISGPGA
jgi:hypothetical protein